jgi:hypothetical protein
MRHGQSGEVGVGEKGTLETGGEAASWRSPAPKYGMTGSIDRTIDSSPSGAYMTASWALNTE